MFAKPLIFVVISVLVVALVYSSFLGSAQGKPVSGTEIDCVLADFLIETCCWWEDKGDYHGYVCQTCVDRDGYPGYEDCGPLNDCPFPCEDPPTSPPTGPATGPLQGGGVLEQPPTSSPFNPAAPLQGGVLEQLQDDQPPLFGRNEAAVPPTGGIVQPFTTITPPLFGNIPQGGGFGILQEPETTPLFGQAAPEGPTLAGEGENIQPMNTTFPTPQPFPPPTPGFKAPQTSIDISPDLAPEDDQDETDDGQDIIPDTGITEQPETQQPEDSSEGAETAGPLT